MDHLQYPCLIFVLYPTDERTIKVTEEVSKDASLLGVDLEVGKEFIIDQKCDRFAASSFDDIVKYYEQNKDKKMRFSDNLLNEYFGIKVE
jgi:hypothetical protein